MRSPDMLASLDITYRQLDYWTRQGYIRPYLRRKSGPGTQRQWPGTEHRIAVVMIRLTKAGFMPHAAARIARVAVESAASDMPTVRVTLPEGLVLLVDTQVEATGGSREV